MAKTKELTTNQRQTLDFIRAYVKRTGNAPTLFEIGAEYGLYMRSVEVRLDGLEKKGFITRTPGESRSIRIVKS